jgi:hypothetical protein
MSITDTLEVLKNTLAKAEQDEEKSKAERATIDGYSRGIDAGIVIGLKLAVTAIERAVAE